MRTWTSIGRSSRSTFLFVLAGCVLRNSESAPPAEVLETVMSADPLHPDFEDRLQHLEPVLDCLLSVDHFVCPELNPEHSRRAFDALARKADAALAAGLTHEPPPILEAEAA